MAATIRSCRVPRGSWDGRFGLRWLALDDLRGRVGLVDDDPHVFASSLYENVRLARPDATEPEVDMALRQVQLGAWVDGLPRGLATMLGDGHAHVSGGERTRIGMARAVLADLRVLVLDEPMCSPRRRHRRGGRRGPSRRDVGAQRRVDHPQQRRPRPRGPGPRDDGPPRGRSA